MKGVKTWGVWDGKKERKKERKGQTAAKRDASEGQVPQSKNTESHKKSILNPIPN